MSEIADQYYCEKKVELTRRYGREATPEMLLGREAHEKLLEGTIKIKMEKLWKQIAYGLPVMVREMLLLGKYKDVIIMGIADGVYFEEGVPKLLLEYKFTRSHRPWHDHHVQARIYCFLLHLMGFNTKKLKYALILAPPKCKVKKGLKKKIIDIIIRNSGKDIYEEKIEGTTLKIYAADFQINHARKELDWALDFWRKKREAIPTKKAGKCTACEFQKLCSASLSGKLNS
ncbi:MAG: PD-(D/E)XK nuclease family protein [Candidatus Freyarchaeota archaeon]